MGKHPVEQDAVGYGAGETAKPGSHGRDHDAGFARKGFAELGDGAAKRLDLSAKVAGSDPDPEPPGFESEPVDVGRDLGRLVPVEGEDADA